MADLPVTNAAMLASATAVAESDGSEFDGNDAEIDALRGALGDAIAAAEGFRDQLRDAREARACG